MKKIKTILGVCLSTLCMLSCQSQPATSYTITGNLEGLPEGSRVQLVPISHDDEKPLVDTVAIHGMFTFKGTANEPLLVALNINGVYGRYAFMLENGKLTIDGKVIINQQGNNTFAQFTDMRVVGSPLTTEYLKKVNVREQMDSIFKANADKFKDISTALSAARVAKNKAKLDSLTTTEAYKAYSAADKKFFATVDSTYKKAVMENKDSFWGPLLMISLTSYLSEEMKPWYEALSPTAKESYYGKKVKEELYPTGKVGSKIPDFTAKGQDGKEVSLTELCQGKKYILIDFWASWCNPCRKEIPNLKKLYAQYADKGFQIVSISIDKKEAEWLKALKEEQLSWPNYRDTEGIATLYKVKFVPTMYLIDAQGVMVAENLRGEDFANKLKELFDK